MVGLGALRKLGEGALLQGRVLRPRPSLIPLGHPGRLSRRACAEGPDAQYLRECGGRCVAAVQGGGAGPGAGRLDHHGAGGVSHRDGEKPFTVAAPAPSPWGNPGQNTGNEDTNKKHIEGNDGQRWLRPHGAQVQAVGRPRVLTQPREGPCPVGTAGSAGPTRT